MSTPLKDPSVRQRRNRVTTTAKLTPIAISSVRVPKLPKREDEQEWQALTKAWWRDTWRSPMASEFLQADIHGLYLLAALVDAFWAKPSKELAAEIRQQRQCFGLTPIDRRRLQWTVERVETATAKRKAAVPEDDELADDPRLRMIK